MDLGGHWDFAVWGDGTADVWSAETGECVECALPSVLTGTHDGTAMIWSDETGECNAGHVHNPTVFSPGASVLMGDDGISEPQWEQAKAEERP